VVAEIIFRLLDTLHMLGFSGSTGMAIEPKQLNEYQHYFQGILHSTKVLPSITVPCFQDLLPPAIQEL